MKEQIYKILQAKGRGWSYLILRIGLKSNSSFFRALETKTVQLKTLEKIAVVLEVPLTDFIVSDPVQNNSSK